MLCSEIAVVRGREFVHTWSDIFTIERDGIEYEEAYDPVGSGREYIETENLLNPETEESID